MFGLKKNRIFFDSFFLKVVLPSLLSVLLFILFIFQYLIPFFKDNMMTIKREMIQELVNTSTSLAKKNYHLVQKGEISDSAAKDLTINEISLLRYGDKLKDYFWITDYQPIMIYHPYRRDLNGKDVSNFKDPDGKRMFYEMVQVVNKYGAGFVNYKWQWMDDSTKIVDKISFVKPFKEWNWIIGTGIYFEDVKEEIESISKTITYVSIIITVFISLLLFYILRQLYKSEQRRSQVSNLLKESRERYKALVESSKEATLMIINNEIVHLNNRISELFDHSLITSFAIDLRNLLAEKMEKQLLDNFINNQEDEINFDTELPGKDKKNVITNVSLIRAKFNNQEAIIITFKEINLINQERLSISDSDLQKYIEELKNDYSQVIVQNENFFNLSIEKIIKEPIYCNSNVNLINAVAQMKFNNTDSLIIKSDDGTNIGIITRNDILKLIPLTDDSKDSPVSRFMSSPLICIKRNEINYNAIVKMSRKKIHHLPIIDDDCNIAGMITKEDLFNIIQSSEDFISYLIDNAENINDLEKEHKKALFHISVMLHSGANLLQIQKFITNISYKIQHRIIYHIFKEIGNPPTNSTLICLGSEARYEQSLTSDQDNAVIIDDSSDYGNYYKLFAEKFNYYLNKVGYPYCDGKIMANNEKLNQPLNTWVNYFSNWIGNATPENILETEIFFDMRTIFGNNNLVEELKNKVDIIVDNNPQFLQILARHCLTLKVPINIFGNIQTENLGENQNLFNIKNPIRVIVNIIRLYSIKYKIRESNTIGRINQLLINKAISEEMAKDLDYAISFLMMLQIKHQANSYAKGMKMTNYIDKNSLTSIEINTIKYILSLIGTLQTKIKYDFSINE